MFKLLEKPMHMDDLYRGPKLNGRSQLIISLRVGILCAIALPCFSRVLFPPSGSQTTMYTTSMQFFCPRLQLFSFPLITMRFTLLASLAVLCGIAFAAPYNAGSGRLVDDAVNNAGSVCQVAGALAAGDLSGALQDAGNINDVENAIAGVISLIGSLELVSILKRDAESSRLV